MNGKEEFSKAIRSLPWYAIGSYLIVPLVCAPFTWGQSFFWYALPFAVFFDLSSPYYGERLMVGCLPFVPGVALWAVRQFLRAATFTAAKNRAA